MAECVLKTCKKKKNATYGKKKPHMKQNNSEHILSDPDIKQPKQRGIFSDICFTWVNTIM